LSKCTTPRKKLFCRLLALRSLIFASRPECLRGGYCVRHS
jgi:hypothetical protein